MYHLEFKNIHLYQSKGKVHFDKHIEEKFYKEQSYCLLVHAR